MFRLHPLAPVPKRTFNDKCDTHDTEFVYNKVTWEHECPKCLEPTAENMARLLAMIKRIQRDVRHLENPNEQD